jgi:hypothetical protein
MRKYKLVPQRIIVFTSHPQIIYSVSARLIGQLGYVRFKLVHVKKKIKILIRF